MILTRDTASPVTIVTADGDLDVYTAPELRSLLTDILDGGCRFIVVDLSKCAFLDHAGLGVIVGCLHRARREGGQVDIICDTPAILKIFRTTGLTKVFGIHETRDAAVAALAGLAEEAVPDAGQ